MSGEKPFAEEGYAVMGAAFEVHNELGGGLGEEIYQESLEIELGLRRIPFEDKKHLALHYKGHELTTKYIPDLMAFGRIVLELKAVSKLIDPHEAQLMNYMRVSRSPVGYLINFGPIGKLEYRRFVLSEFI